MDNQQFPTPEVPETTPQLPAEQPYAQPESTHEIVQHSPAHSFPPAPSYQQSAPAQFEQPAAVPVELPVAPPVPPVAVTPQASELSPQPVVRVLSPRGIEYVFMTIALLMGAIGLGSALISLVNKQDNFTVLAFPVAVLVVSLPTFAWLFLRLKKAESLNPALKLDASKRRSTQFTQIVTFLTCFFTMIGLVTAIFAKLSGNFDGSIVKLILDVLVVFVVAGGILAYYWHDEHAKV
jgi:hypothetical protein